MNTIKTMPDIYDSGYLSLYVGPMYSGKTSKLLELYKQYAFCNIKTIVINFEGDTRYSKENMLSSHDKVMIPCVKASKLKEIADILNEKAVISQDFINSSVILINEGQFFDDIVPWVSMAISSKYKKQIHICGLDGDFKREKFGCWLDLIPLCDNIEKLHSYCSDCKRTFAIFSYRISDEKEQTIIGSSNYIPLCRKCYDARISV